MATTFSSQVYNPAQFSTPQSRMLNPNQPIPYEEYISSAAQYLPDYYREQNAYQNELRRQKVEEKTLDLQRKDARYGQIMGGVNTALQAGAFKPIWKYIDKTGSSLKSVFKGGPGDFTGVKLSNVTPTYNNSIPNNIPDYKTSYDYDPSTPEVNLGGYGNETNIEGLGVLPTKFNPTPRTLPTTMGQEPSGLGTFNVLPKEAPPTLDPNASRFASNNNVMSDTETPYAGFKSTQTTSATASKALPSKFSDSTGFKSSMDVLGGFGSGLANEGHQGKALVSALGGKVAAQSLAKLLGKGGFNPMSLAATGAGALIGSGIKMGKNERKITSAITTGMGYGSMFGLPGMVAGGMIGGLTQNKLGRSISKAWKKIF